MGLNISADIQPGGEMDGRTKLHRFRYHLGRGFVGREDTVADLGCGQGYGSKILAETAKKVIGIDVDEPQIVWNQEHIEGIEFIHDDLETMDLPDVDVSVSFEVIEHTFAPDKFVENIKKHTKKFIVVSVPCGAEKLIMVDGIPQADGDSTHHSVFDRQEDLDRLFIDGAWDKFYSFQTGVTYMAAYYNKGGI